MDRAYRVVYILEGEEHVQVSLYLTLRGASDEAWLLRSRGLVAWAEPAA